VAEAPLVLLPLVLLDSTVDILFPVGHEVVVHNGKLASSGSIGYARTTPRANAAIESPQCQMLALGHRLDAFAEYLTGLVISGHPAATVFLSGCLAFSGEAEL
jgi:hypothetical protein